MLSFRGVQKVTAGTWTETFMCLSCVGLSVAEPHAVLQRLAALCAHGDSPVISDQTICVWSLFLYFLEHDC